MNFLRFWKKIDDDCGDDDDDDDVDDVNEIENSLK